MGAGLIDDFISNILSIPFGPYHFVRYHFVLEPYFLIQTEWQIAESYQSTDSEGAGFFFKIYGYDALNSSCLRDVRTMGANCKPHQVLWNKKLFLKGSLCAVPWVLSDRQKEWQQINSIKGNSEKIHCQAPMDSPCQKNEVNNRSQRWWWWKWIQQCLWRRNTAHADTR